MPDTEAIPTARQKEESIEPIPGEEVVYDYNFCEGDWGVFGVYSGHRYSTWADEQDADRAADEMNERREAI